MTLFTKREKHVILFLMCTLMLGYGVKLYQGIYLYDDFNPLTSIEKESFEKIVVSKLVVLPRAIF